MNQAIIDVGGAVVGDERAFWLGMKEDTSVFGDGRPVGSSAIEAYDSIDQEYLKEHTTDIDGIAVGYDGWDNGDGVRKPQPSNALNGRDKHTTGETEDCVRQLGTNGWNDAMCTRTWSGARKRNILMGHVCEARAFDPPMVHTGEFEEAFHTWAGSFLAPNAAGRWQAKISTFASNLRDNILTKPCAVEAGAPNYSGISTIDENGDASSQLTTIVDDMESFFNEFLGGCTAQRQSDSKTALEVKVERIQAMETKLSDALSRLPAN